jgi:hypothetical protein
MKSDFAGTQLLLEKYYPHGDLNWLRKLRNMYVHLDVDNSAVTMDDWYYKASQMETDATRAVEVVIKALYQNPGI